MKILYAVQATGNGHISRAITLLPYLRSYGDVDIFLSGDNCGLRLEIPVKFRSKGISLYYNASGGLSYTKIARNLRPLRVLRDIRSLPVTQYDLVLNDFDFITAAACARKGAPCFHFGHQASFASPLTPRAEPKDPVGELVLRRFARCKQAVGFHFKKYDHFIFPPVIKSAILEATPRDLGYFTVYLPSFSEQVLAEKLKPLQQFRFQVFTRSTVTPRKAGHIQFMPVNSNLFNESLIHCSGIITGAGFETPAEALQLGKKIMVNPIKGQYEQACNAAALRDFGVPSITKIDGNFAARFLQWVSQPAPARQNFSGAAQLALNYLFDQFATRQLWVPA